MTNTIEEVDTRLQSAIVDERVSRIAGDDANKSLTIQVADQLLNVDSRVSTEIVQRVEGDLGNLNNLNAISAALAAYRLKSELELNDESIMRGALDVELKRDIAAATAYFDFNNYEIYQAIQDAQNQFKASQDAMDIRIKKYENMLQDITTDSKQITTDNGQLRMGAWTILSQAREWDLEILAKMHGFQEKTTEDVNQALEDLQNQLPITENIINELMENLSESPLISELRDALNESIDTTGGLELKLALEEAARAEEMIKLAARQAEALALEKQDLINRLAQEAEERVDAITREAYIRSMQLTQVEDDKAIIEEDMNAIRLRVTNAENGITSEIQQRKDGDTSNLSALNTYKVSNDTAVSGLATSISNNVTKTSANTTAIAGLTSRLTTAETETGSVRTLAADAMNKASSAVTANGALSTRVDALAASITESDGTVVDVNAFNALKAEVNTNKGSITSIVEDVTALENSYSTVNNKQLTQGTAISNLTTKMTTAENTIKQSADDIVLLKSGITTINGTLTNKVDAQAFNNLSTAVDTLENGFSTQASNITALSGSIDTTNVNVGNAASAAQNAMSAAGAKGKVIFGTTAPAVADRLSQNLWIDTVGNANTPKRWNGSAWVTVTDKVATDALAAASAATTLANTKADTTAFNSLDQKVTVIDGKVSTNTNSITSLNGKIAIVEGGLATKLDSSAIVNYYTKQQTDDKALSTAAGEVSKYDASLSIGGVNLLTNTKWDKLADVGTSGSFLWTTDANYSFFTQYNLQTGGIRINPKVSPEGTTVVAAYGTPPDRRVSKLVAGRTYTLSFTGQGTFNSLNYVYILRHASEGGNHMLPAMPFGSGGSTRRSITFEAPWASDTVGILIGARRTWLSTDWYSISELQLEEGSKATPWEPSYLDVQSQLDTNATAITNTNAEVSRVDGRVTTESNRITTLTGRVSTVEGDISKKADASALNSLTTRVTTEEGKTTSQGNAITSLQNTVNHATTGLSTKASTSALTATNSEVSRVNGVVVGHTNQLTQLTADITAINGNLATKANASALNNYWTKAQFDDQTKRVTAGEISNFSASLAVGGTNILPNSDFSRGYSASGTGTIITKVVDPTSLTETFKVERGTSSACGIVNNGTTRTMKVVQGRTYTLSFRSASSRTSLNYVYLMRDDGVNQSLGGVAGVTGDTSRLAVTFVSSFSSNNAYILMGCNDNNPYWFTVAELKVEEGNIATAWSKSDADLQQQITANATAVSTTNSEVSRIDGVVSGHTTQLSNLTASIAGKADTTALNALTVRVATEEGKSSSQATSITNLTSSVENALDSVTVSDTRSTNEPPSWYLAKYPRRVVNEFKNQTAIGVGGFFGGTYCNLETKVYYSDLSGGDIIQTATSSVDPSLYVQRRSNGVSAWTAWAQPIKDLRDGLAGKASASALSTLDTKVEEVDGRVATQASQLLVLTSDNSANKNALTVQGRVIDGVKASYMVKMETNGVIGGFGLMQSTGVLGQVVTSFGVNANSFFVGAPASKKQPFIVTTTNQVVNGVTYPAGTYIDVALIANATIGGAKIQNASIDTAQIKDAAITSAKIKDLTADKISVPTTAGVIDKLSGTNATYGGTGLSGLSALYDGSFKSGSSYASFGNGSGAGTGGETAYLQVDLKALKRIQDISMWYYCADGRRYYYKVKVSIDGTNWDYLVGDSSTWALSQEVRKLNDSYANTTTVERINSPGMYFRYLRIYGDGNTTNAGNHLYELNVSSQPISTVIDGNGILTNSITADNLSVASLSAISANLGTMVSLKNQSKPNGARTVITGALYETFDDNNVRRVRLGYW